MNKAALTKHEIYNKLTEFSEQELAAVVAYIDFMRHKKQLEEKKIIKLEGTLKGYDIDFAELKKLKQESWNHVDKEFLGG